MRCCACGDDRLLVMVDALAGILIHAECRDEWLRANECEGV